MGKRYILEGPASAGNAMGYWKENLVPPGRWAVVEDDEYANGGRGPCSVDGLLYDSREAAERALGCPHGHRGYVGVARQATATTIDVTCHDCGATIRVSGPGEGVEVEHALMMSAWEASPEVREDARTAAEAFR